MSNRYSKFILKSIKENFGAEEKYETEGFPDLNYEVGNTSGLDVAPGVPSAMDERIGSLAQRGGSVMEVIINNPATFQLDKDKMFNVINQLGINISIHSNPDIGYTSAYRGRYDPTHDYFTKYLQEFAIFKKEAETRAQDEENFGFEIQRINPHISTTPLPALEEERAQDTGLDPFGYSLTDLKEDVMDEKDSREKNIWQNEDFLRRFFRTFMLDFMEGNENRYYAQLFSDYSEQFNKEWNDARDEVLNDKFKDRSNAEEDHVEEKATLIGIAGAGDAEVSTKWYDYLAKYDLKNPVDLEGQKNEYPRDEIASLEDLDEYIRKDISINYGLNALRRVPEIYRLLQTGDLGRIATRNCPLSPEKQKDIHKKLREPLGDALQELWKEKDDTGEPLIPVDNKTQAIARHFEIAQQRLIEQAFDQNEKPLRNSAEEVVSGSREYFKNGGERGEDPEDLHLKFIQRLTQQFEQQIWMESNIMYKIMPAWMSVADKDEYKGHKGWEAPKFLWELLVERKWEDKEGYNIDLTDPRGNENDEIGFLDLLEESREFQADVAAASAACYVWGHFTQKESPFKVEKEKHFEDIGREEGKMTWIKWMNEYGIGVNLEAMPGSPQQMYKIWRPKDIVAACRAINITARKELDEIHEDLDEMPAKFTLDLEHTATFGLNPWKTMDELIYQEKDLAESPLADKYNLEVDSDKPLAKVLRMWHLMRAGVETSQSQTLHGPWDRGDTQLYEWLYKMVDAGFARNPGETAYIMYEVGGDDRGTVYTARIAMNLIELGVDYKDLDPTKVDPSKKQYGDEKEALMARFFGMDKSTYDREWAKIEEHAFDPLDGLLEAEQFDYTWSSQAAIENDNRPQDWMQEEFK